MTFDAKGNYLEYTIYSNDNPSTYDFTNKYDSTETSQKLSVPALERKPFFIYGPTRAEKITQTNNAHILDKWFTRSTRMGTNERRTCSR